MVGALANVEGHRSKYEMLKRSLPPEEVGKTFVGGGDPVQIGFIELEVIRRFKPLEGASVVDIGCGIGRLTQHMLHENISTYLGIDIIPEIMAEAAEKAKDDPRFGFAIAENCKIPAEDASVDIIVAYSVITHLLDEESYEYFQEFRRVLKPGGVVIISFLDFMYKDHVDNFFLYASLHRKGHGDLLKFTTKEVLSLFAHRAGFAGVEFIDGSVALKTSGLTSPIMPADKIPPTFTMIQSACVLRPNAPKPKRWFSRLF